MKAVLWLAFEESEAGVIEVERDGVTCATCSAMPSVCGRTGS
jgi:hypothetical protein